MAIVCCRFEAKQLLRAIDVMLQSKKKTMKDYIINVSKKYSIVTQFTSFIAVEKREKVKARRECR